MRCSEVIARALAHRAWKPLENGIPLLFAPGGSTTLCSAPSTPCPSCSREEKGMTTTLVSVSHGPENEGVAKMLERS